ncbi:MAG: CoA transferase [Steroidobacteraceae bacterium]
MSTSNTGALSHIRVIDFGHYIAGPLAALMLAEHGAEVIHINRPGSLSMPTRDDAFLNRSKQRVTLDLKNPIDLQQARALIAGADVMIENFRPGVMARLGLDLPALRTANPQLTTCSLPGFSERDPRSQIPGWEGIVSSAAGLYNLQGPAGQLTADRSPYNELPLASNFAAFQAATAIVMALIAREKTGRGQHIEAPLFDGAIELLGPAVPDTFPNYTIINGGGIYACAHGHVFFNANNPRFLFWLLDAVNMTQELREAGLLEPNVINDKDIERNKLFRARMAALFRSRTAAEWEDFAAQHHLPLSRMRDLPEWQASEAARASGAVATVNDPELGPLDQPGYAVNLSVSQEAIQHARHLPDQDRDEVLGKTRAVRAIQNVTDDSLRQALAGIRVLDLANILAGPSVGRWLADFGAEVIKINDPNALSVALHDYLNRGKKSALINANSPEGRAAVLQLAERSDVFLSNFPKPTAKRYGYDEDSVRQHQPNIVYTAITCYGAKGPWRERRGYEPQAQAAAGVMNAYGGSDSPVMLPYLINDYGTGILGAFATGLALFHRTRTGIGQRAEASLAQTATLHQWGRLLETWHQHLYRSSDGWLFIAQPVDNTAALRKLFDIASSEQSDSNITAIISTATTQQPTQYWLERCAKHGITAMQLETQRSAMQTPYAIEHGLTHAARQRMSGTLEHPGITVHLSGTPKIHGAVPEAAGTDLEEVFAIGGMSDRLESLLDKGVVRHRLSKPGVAPPSK